MIEDNNGKTTINSELEKLLGSKKLEAFKLLCVNEGYNIDVVLRAYVNRCLSKQSTI